VVKLRKEPLLKDAKYKLFNGREVSFSSLGLASNWDFDPDLDPIPDAAKAQMFYSWFMTTFREEPLPVQELAIIQTKLESNCLQIKNPNGLFPMGVGLYMEATPVKGLPLNSDGAQNAALDFEGNLLYVQASRDILPGEEVTVPRASSFFQEISQKSVSLKFN
jgi:hypothetical protein